MNSKISVGHREPFPKVCVLWPSKNSKNTRVTNKDPKSGSKNLTVLYLHTFQQRQFDQIHASLITDQIDISASGCLDLSKPSDLVIFFNMENSSQCIVYNSYCLSNNTWS